MARSDLHSDDKLVKGRYFRLGPDHLRMIVEIVKRRLPESRFKFTARHAESFSYDIGDLEELIGTVERQWRRIDSLEFWTHSENCHLLMGFNREYTGHVYLSVEGDREITDAVSSDLRSYLAAEILKPSWPGKAAFIGSIIILGGALWVFILRQIPPRPALPSMEEVLSKPELSAKLDYLIRRLEPRELPTSLGISLAATIVLFWMAIQATVFSRYFTDSKILPFLFPQNTFLFGSERKRDDRIRDLRSRVFWAVIVGCVVSLVAGMIVWNFTRAGS